MARFTAGLLVGAAMTMIGLAALGAHAAAEGGTGGDDSDARSSQVIAEPSPVSEPGQSDTSQSYTSQGSSIWDRLAQCESNQRWDIATGNGFYGGLQFDLPSWRAAGGSGRPDQASRAEQIRVGMNWQHIRGWSAWPYCSRILGLR